MGPPYYCLCNNCLTDCITSRLTGASPRLPQLVPHLLPQQYLRAQMAAEQMWQLLMQNYHVESLVDVTKCMKQLPWSSIGCEQGHVAASIMKRYHPEIQENMATAVPFLCMLQPMITPGEQVRAYFHAEGY